MPEPEALKLAVVFEETAAYQYRKNKEAESNNRISGSQYNAGFEEEFSFGEQDDSDYWDRPDITEGIPIT